MHDAGCIVRTAFDSAQADLSQRDIFINIRGEAQYPPLRATASHEHSAVA